jgi:predicted DNA-binding protein (MmcQ/YjbR family)
MASAESRAFNELTFSLFRKSIREGDRKVPLPSVIGYDSESMDVQQYNQFCASLTAVTYVVQWGDAHVWKVGGKVFAVGGWSDEAGSVFGVTFKTTPDEYEFLVEMPGLRPAPYLASRGFTWVQNYAVPGLADDDLMEQIQESHRIVGEGLSKIKQRELGLLD